MKTTISSMVALAILAIGCMSTTEAQAATKKRKIVDFVFHELDANGDKNLSEHEFIGKKSGEAKESARKRFRALDGDSDRSLSHTEFKAFHLSK
jgi:hypothetical protein